MKLKTYKKYSYFQTLSLYKIPYKIFSSQLTF